jgi:DNA-binding CsgD family transcriptional regulator
MIDARLATLSSDARTLLQAASVIGADVPVDLLGSVSGLEQDRFVRAVDEATTEHVLEDTGDLSSVRFRHPLFRQALYEGLPLIRRRALHERSGRLLASMPRTDDDAVANHLWRAQVPDAAPWLVRAGHDARQVFAPATAVDRYTKAIELAAAKEIDLPRSIWRSRGEANSIAGNFAAAEHDLKRGLELAGQPGSVDPREQWECLVQLGILWASRDYRQAGAYWSQALELSKQIDDPFVRARSLSWIGNWHLNTGRLEEVITPQLEALELYEAHGDPAGIAEASGLLAVAHVLQGDIQQALDYSLRGIEGSSAGTRRDRLVALAPTIASGGVFEYSAEMPATLPATIDPMRTGQEAIGLAVETGWSSNEAFARIAYASYLGYHGFHGQALEHGREALRLAQEIEHRQWTALANISLGHLALDRFDIDTALGYLQVARELAQQIGSYFHTRLSAAPLSRAWIAAGELGRARDVLGEVLDASDARHTAVERDCWAAAADLELALGNPATALEIIDRLIATTINGGPGKIVPRLGLLRGQALMAVEAWPEAIETLGPALTMAEARGFQPTAFRLQHHLAVACRHAGNPREASSYRDAALQTIQSIAGSMPDAEMRQRFLERAPGGQAAPGEEGWSSGLSRREAEVLQLVAQGLTNVEIAERLFVTPRTIKGHLQSIFNKYGVNTRTAAVAIALERGLRREDGETGRR